MAHAESHDGRIQSYALLPYTEQGFPDTVRQFRSRLPEIESYRRKTAERALASGKCDSVEFAELSTESTLSNLKFWADCTNGHRFYLTEQEIDSDAAAVAQEDKSWTREAAIFACRDAILNRALIPDAVKIHSLTGTRFEKAPLTHNVILDIDFDAVTAMGVPIPYTAKCHFEPGKVGTIDISMRKRK